jgi:hypothetical protein
VTQYAPSARPGSRAPHVWLQRDGERLSTIDLYGGRFVLLTGPQGDAWIDAATALASAARPELVAHRVGGSELGDPEQGWQAAYELDPEGAVLVRPDGYVCWRNRAGAADPASVLREVFDQILSRGT